MSTLTAEVNIPQVEIGDGDGDVRALYVTFQTDPHVMAMAELNTLAKWPKIYLPVVSRP